MIGVQSAKPQRQAGWLQWGEEDCVIYDIRPNNSPGALYRSGSNRPAQPGRDCPACVCARDCHDGYGCRVCGCALSIALVTWRRYAP